MSGWVRGLCAGDACMALKVCDTRDFDGTLPFFAGLWGKMKPLPGCANQTQKATCPWSWLKGWFCCADR